MNYTCDTEFNGFGGGLISLALYREDGESLYLIYDLKEKLDPWVAENVIPILNADLPENTGKRHLIDDWNVGADLIADFFGTDLDPYVVVDWPDDMKYFCQAIMKGPGYMANIKRVIFDVVRVNAYPTDNTKAVRHNSWWDAKVLFDKLNLQ